MEPRIQYAKTSDGVNIAYWTIGAGMPLLATSGGTGSPSLRSWRTPEGRAFWEKVAQERLVIRYDHRGAGNSDVDISEVTFESYVADLEAVADQASPGEFALCGYGACAPIAIGYASRHPERVSKLILFNASARGSDFYGFRRLRKALEIADDDPEFYLLVIAAELGITGEQAESFLSSQLRDVDPRVRRMALELQSKMDVTHLLPQIAVPTLVLQRRDLRRPSLDAARTLATGIPGAQLVVLEGDSLAPYIGDADAVLSAIDEFLGDRGEMKPQASPVTGDVATVHTILFTDLVGHTEMMSRLGDERGRDVLREHERITRDVLTEHGGTEVKTMGDGFMVSFTSVSRAMDCAIALQGSFAEHNASSSEPLQVRVGLNAGEPIEEDGDLFGSTVILASRIAAKAGAGEILIAEPLRHLLAGKTYVYADRGETIIKGFEDAVRLFELLWRDSDAE